MTDKKPQLYFLLVVLIGALVLTFFVFRPFLYAFILAMIFATAFQPVYQKILKFAGGRQTLSALATVLIVVILVLLPLIFLGTQIFKEAHQLYLSFANNGGENTFSIIFNELFGSFKEYFPDTKEFSLDIGQYLKQGLGWLIQNFGSIFGSVAKMTVDLFLFLVAFYYLLKDGKKLKTSIVALSPLLDSDDETISQKLRDAVNAVIRGNLLIALVQGILASIGFSIFGVPNAVLWGGVTAIAALIPGIGTTLIVFPAIVFLLLKGSMLYGIGLAVWGILAVGLVDNFLGPKLIGRGTRLHPLLILLSVLGGISFFGPIGFLLGPLAISFLFALLSIYSSLITKTSS